MANVLVQESSLQDIADAIRSKNGTQNTYKPAQMADAIEAISGGGITPTGTINITANGTHDVTNYASASVAVPTGTTPTGTKQVSITQNGTTTEDVTNYASAEITVNVPTGGSEPSLGTKSITANGTYTASDDSLDGYSSVTVNVAGGGSVQKTTGTFTGSGNATQDINCSFEPDIIKIYRSDIANMTAVADRCIAALYIAKDGAYTATHTMANVTSLSNGGHGIKEATATWSSGFNISTTLYASYSNGVLTVSSGNGQRYSSSLTYNYEFIFFNN